MGRAQQDLDQDSSSYLAERDIGGGVDSGGLAETVPSGLYNLEADLSVG